MMKFYLNNVYAAVVFLLLFCTSCGDADLFDTDKWSDNIDGLEPDIRVKVGHGDFTLWNLLMDSTGYIQKVPDSGNPADSVLAIRYTQKDIYELDNLSSIFDMSLGELVFDMPDVEVDGFGHDITLTEDYPLTVPGIPVVEVPISDIPAGCEVKEILASVSISVSMPRQEFTHKVTVNFKNLYVKGVPFSYVCMVDKADGTNGVAQEGTISLPGALLNLREFDGIKIEATDTIIKGQTIVSGTIISGGSIRLSDLHFIKAAGKLRTEPMSVNGNFDLDIDFLDKINGNFQFAEPELKIIVRNKGIGVAANLQMDFWVKDGVGDNRFNGEPLAFPINRDTTTLTGSVKYTGDALARFLSLPPSGLVNYQGQVMLNGGDDYNDVIWKNGSVSMDAEINIPLKLSAEELLYRDTINDISVDSDIADKIMSGSITLEASNGVPLELILDNLILADDNYNELASIPAVDGRNKLGAAKGNAATNGKLEFALNKEQAKLLGKTKYILIDVKAATPLENGVRNSVTVYADAKLRLDVVLNAQIKINNFDF